VRGYLLDSTALGLKSNVQVLWMIMSILETQQAGNILKSSAIISFTKRLWILEQILRLTLIKSTNTRQQNTSIWREE
jgi:hypothetical protein